MKKFWIPIGVLAAIGLLLAYALGKMTTGELSPRTIPSPLVGKPLPAFALPTLEQADRNLTNADLRGKPVLINVFASWCVACRDEHEELMALSRSKAVKMVGLNYKDARADALGFLSQFGNPYDLILADVDGRTGIDWGVYGVPETFVLDGNGVIRHKHIGPLTEQDVQQKLLPLLKELSSPASSGSS